ncbi:MAG: SBBP repeat-containing protein [Bacteroidota bacterium]
MPDGVSYVFSKTEKPKQPVSEATGLEIVDPLREDDTMEALTSVYRMDMKLDGCNKDAHIRSTNELEGYSNYYYAHCPNGITNVKSFGSIVYANIYDHIDLVFRSSIGRMKYEFIVHPGGNPNDILLRYAGADRIGLNAEGSIQIDTPLGSFEERAPFTYQDRNTVVESRFEVKGIAVTFAIGVYDTEQDLIIDPWVTFYGGSGAERFNAAVCAGAGSYLVTGSTGSTNFPVASSWQGTYAGGSSDACIVKLNDAQQLVWATYYGGSDYDVGASLALGSNNIVAVSGWTSSTDLPVTQNAYQSTYAGGFFDACIMVFNSGGVLVWASYLGGSEFDSAWGVTFDSSDNLYVAGQTTSSDYPVSTGAYQQTYGGNVDLFISSFSSPIPSTVSRLWSTYLGGSGNEETGGWGIIACNASMVAIQGATSSSDFPVTASAFQNIIGGNSDAAIAAFSLSGNVLWSTYFGGNAFERVGQITSDGYGNFYIAGQTESANFPVLNAYQSTKAGGRDLYLAKLSSAGGLLWSTYYGGSAHEGNNDNIAVACDQSGNAYLGSHTQSDNFPVFQEIQGSRNGGNDLGIAKFDPNGIRCWATYYGGSLSDIVGGIAVDPSGYVLIAGTTSSTNFPLFAPLLGTTYGGGSNDGFVMQITISGTIPVELSSLSASRLNEDITIRWTTESETNNAGFRIERMTGSNTDWEFIDFIPGVGTSFSPRKYTFIDKLEYPLTTASKLFYRLRQIDFNGKENLSPVVEVWIEDSPLSLDITAVYPHPMRTESCIKITLPEEQRVSMLLYDALGCIVQILRNSEMMSYGVHLVSINLASVPKGIYSLVISSENGRAVRRIVIE